MIWTGENWEIRQGRWQDSLPDSVVDHIISDPPFDTRTHKHHELGCRHRDAVQFDPIDPVDIVGPLLSWCTGWMLCFCSIEQMGAYAAASVDRWVRSGLWIKPDATPQFSGDRPAQPGEGIAIMHSGAQRKKWNGRGRPARWEYLIARGAERLHETPKPIDLMMALVSDFTQPNDLVWDPYCGSGTTGVACLRLGRRFLGHEMQPHYAEIAAKRLAAEDRCLTVADVDRGQLSIMDLTGEQK